MTSPKPDFDEVLLWRRAARRLALADPEPALTSATVDRLLETLGPRPEGQELRSWLRGGRRPGAAAPAGEGALIIPFDPKRHRLRPVAHFTRLAADSAGAGLELPAGELESQEGQFRLKVRGEAGEVVLEVQALGFTTDEFANRVVGLAGPGDDLSPVAVIALDEDADGSVCLPDSDLLRRALLRPVIGVVEEI